MFSGIVERACPVLAVTGAGGLRRIVVDLAPLRGQLPGAPEQPAAPDGTLVALGDSVAIQGVCLTVAARAGDEATFEIVPETLSRTTLGGLVAGSTVNCERALCYGARVDGHLVQGHVERTGEVLAVECPPGETRLSVACGADFTRAVLPKGSIAVDGVSLTVAALGSDQFTVALVPHTLERTTLGRLVEGDRVNLEADMIGQWVLKAVAQQGKGAPA